MTDSFGVNVRVARHSAPVHGARRRQRCDRFLQGNLREESHAENATDSRRHRGLHRGGAGARPDNVRHTCGDRERRSGDHRQGGMRGLCDAASPSRAPLATSSSPPVPVPSPVPSPASPSPRLLSAPPASSLLLLTPGNRAASAGSGFRLLMASSATDRRDRDPSPQPGLAIAMTMLGPGAPVFLASAALWHGG